MAYLSIVDLLAELDNVTATACADPAPDLLGVMPVLAAVARPLRQLASDGVSPGYDERSAVLTELAAACSAAGAAWRGMPDTHLGQLVGAIGDVIGHASHVDLGRDARWAVALRLSDVARSMSDTLAGTPYEQLELLAHARAAAVAVARAGAGDPPEPAMLRTLDRPRLPGPQSAGSEPARRLQEGLARLTYQLHRPGAVQPPIVLEAICRAAAAAANQPDTAAARTELLRAAGRLSRMTAPDLRTPSSRHVYAAAADLRQAAGADLPAADVRVELGELAEAVTNHVTQLAGHALVRPGRRPYSEARVPEFLSRPGGTFLVDRADVEPIIAALSRAAEALAGVREASGTGTRPGVAEVNLLADPLRPDAAGVNYPSHTTPVVQQAPQPRHF